MPFPTWPDGVRYRPRKDDFQPYEPFLAPISSEFNQGNTRSRPRPGDNVGKITQTIEMPNSELAIWSPWVRNTLNNGTARFKAQVYIDGAYVEKVCKFHEKVPTPVPISELWSAVTMTLRVFGV